MKRISLIIFLLISFINLIYSQKRIPSIAPITTIDKYSKSEFADKVDTDSNGKLSNGERYKDVMDDLDLLQGNWVFKKTKDDFSGEVSRIAIKNSDRKYWVENPNGLIGTTTLKIINNERVFLSHQSHLFGKGVILFKFDNNPPKSFSFSFPDNSNYNFIKINVDQAFIQDIINSKILLIRVPVFQHGFQDLRFYLKGFEIQ